MALGLAHYWDAISEEFLEKVGKRIIEGRTPEVRLKTGKHTWKSPEKSVQRMNYHRKNMGARIWGQGLPNRIATWSLRKVNL
jgi:hypothetical protein